MTLKINIQNPRNFRAHRSGWGYVIKHLQRLHQRNSILFDDFIDISFGYNRLDNVTKGIIPYTKPWLGVLHHPPNICPWYNSTYKNNIDIHNFLNSTEFLISLEKCQCIIVLSDYLKKYLLNHFEHLKNIPIVSLKHPTEPGELCWDFDKFKKAANLYGLKILSIGYFLRNMTSIYRISTNKKLDKYLLPSHIQYGLNNLSLELQYKNLSSINRDSIKILNWQQNSFYDKLLEQSMVFLDLYDTSCNNAIIESIARHTPLLVNKHPAVEEYVGSDYPLYYENIDDIKNLLTYDQIYAAYEYYKSNNHLYDYLNPEYFIQTFDSEVSLALDTIKVKPKKKTNSSNTYSVITQPTFFNHRYGWPYVTKALNKIYPFPKKTEYDKCVNKIFLNNFTEHTFKSDTQRSKIIFIDNKKYTATRGYNLFSGNNTDIVYVDEKYYHWQHNTWETITENHITKIDKLCEMNKVHNYKNYPWIGFLHNPINMPFWFDYNQNIYSILDNIHFKDSIINCKLFITLSESLKQDISNIFKSKKITVPVVSIKHPTKFTKQKFDINRFFKNPRVCQIGYWLRNMHSIWELRNPKIQKIWLYGDKFALDMIMAEKKFSKNDFKLKAIDYEQLASCISNGSNAQIQDVAVAKLSPAEYDDILRSSVVFLNLYASSANNAILECISKATPILVNKLPSVIEYLGEKYPLYYTSLREASALSHNFAKIQEAHEYLLGMDNHKSLSLRTFLMNTQQEIKNICKKL